MANKKFELGVRREDFGLNDISERKFKVTLKCKKYVLKYKSNYYSCLGKIITITI